MFLLQLLVSSDDSDDLTAPLPAVAKYALCVWEEVALREPNAVDFEGTVSGSLAKVLELMNYYSYPTHFLCYY